MVTKTSLTASDSLFKTVIPIVKVHAHNCLGALPVEADTRRDIGCTNTIKFACLIGSVNLGSVISTNTTVDHANLEASLTHNLGATLNLGHQRGEHNQTTFLKVIDGMDF